jgi:hypothetical protein
MSDIEGEDIARVSPHNQRFIDQGEHPPAEPQDLEIQALGALCAHLHASRRFSTRGRGDRGGTLVRWCRGVCVCGVLGNEVRGSAEQGRDLVEGFGVPSDHEFAESSQRLVLDLRLGGVSDSGSKFGGWGILCGMEGMGRKRSDVRKGVSNLTCRETPQACERVCVFTRACASHHST